MKFRTGGGKAEVIIAAGLPLTGFGKDENEGNDTLLLPEGVCPGGVRARQVVSYGLGGRNTLTLSSMDTHLMLSVQRQLTDLRGETVEVQEIALPDDWQRWEKPQMLALAGVCLLCGAL